MAVHYTCKHCKMSIGTLSHTVESSEELGINVLDNSHRDEVLTYAENGDIHVRAICEDCHEALTRNPTLYELDSFIQ
ncbi:anti-sigma-F factor Fin family protein [Alkalicoccobacillus murimartini]|uniref:Anti-sigma-F factor Fin family protein n=1 Tax=Alkalicoccobacillus murimartini TaxID=171685 RepID=A0ABT9YNW8_9BACI|nr:anti-sigma-F factor Fin family protein [Alkalicoccobacillus murimartini]MDQ0209190.1 hypothetical protein [Alkalicoccobacillus murimartini]